MPRHHHWPVTMQAGGVVLRPMRRADEARWTTTRELDWDWLGPWEATKPPGSHAVSYTHLTLPTTPYV